MATTTTVTVLCADLTRSRAEADDVGRDPDHDPPLRWLDQQVAAVAAGYGGHLVDTGTAAFPSASAAVSAAVDLQRRAATVDVGPGLCIGLATGEADVEGTEYFGRPLIEATRLCHQADARQVLVADLVRLLDGGRAGHPYRPLGEQTIEGLDQPIAVAEVRWTDAAPASADAGEVTVPLPNLLALEAAVPFVARTSEWERLELAWLTAREGRRQVVLIGGEPGAGKTRLVTEFARASHRRDGIVLYGACTEAIELPFQPFAEAFGNALESLSDEQQRAMAGTGHADLSRMLHQLDPVSEPLPTGGVPDPAASRYRLHEAATELLVNLSAAAPVLLVIDDVHWARRPTIQLLEHLVRSPRLGRVCILATFRTAPADINAPLRESLPELRRRPGVERVLLGGFDHDGVRAFLSALAGQDVDAELGPLVAHLETNTDGNAFLLGELWRELVDSGHVRWRGDRWTVVGSLDAVSSPESVREVVADRVARLPDETRTALELAAVAGPSFELSTVAAAAGIDQGAAFDALEPAVAARLVDDAGADHFRFAHALVRRSVEDSLSPGDRRRHHLAIALALEERGTGDAAALARHFAEAVPLAEADTAVGYARQAADNAMQAVAYEDAASVLTGVLPLVTDARERADLLLRVAIASARSGSTNESIQLCGRVAGIARKQGDHDLLVRAAVMMAEATWRGAAFGGPAVALTREALDGPNDEATHTRLLAGLSTALAFSGEDDEALRIGAEAISACRAVGDRALLLEALGCLTFVGWRPSTIDQQLDAVTEGLALAEELDDEDALLGRLDKLMAGLMIVGDVERHAAVLEQHGRLARQLRQPLFQLIDLQVQGVVALNQGRFADAERLAGEASRWSDELPHASGGYGVQMFAIRREQARLDEVRPVVEAVAAQGQEGSTWRPGLAAVYAELGLIDACRGLLDELVADDLALVPRDSLWVGSLTFLADACAAVGARDEAEVVFAELRPYSGLMATVPALACFGAADRYLGRLSEVRQRPSEALGFYESALRADERAGWPVWIAHSRLAIGRLLAERGRSADRDRAATLLGVAQETATGLGQPAVAARCRTLLDGLDSVSESPPASLTPRELSVLRLVADGMTNRQIGGSLHLSEHTVANHMRSILLKTGCASRAEAAVYATRHRLLDL